MGRRTAPAPDLPEIARALARGCAAGLPVPEALTRAAASVDDGSALLLDACAARLAAGEPVGMALAPMAAYPGGIAIVGAVELHAELGGDLVASLFAVGEALADRERLRLEARAAPAQARIATRALPLAPVASLGLLGVLAPAALQALVTTRPGLTLLTVAAFLTGVAVVLLRRIATGAGV
ncbi:MAG: type II secretion system F family protein [Gaiellales bacterium]